MREREVEAYLIRQVKVRGGETRKVKWIGRKGAPDRLVGLNGDSCLVELKKPKGGILEAHQMREHERLRKIFGLRVFTAYTTDEVDDLIAQLWNR